MLLGLPTDRLEFVLAVAADVEGEAGGGGGPLHRSKKDSIKAICTGQVHFVACVVLVHNKVDAVSFEHTIPSIPV